MNLWLFLLNVAMIKVSKLSAVIPRFSIICKPVCTVILTISNTVLRLENVSSHETFKNCDLLKWPQLFLQPLDLQECTVPHLKDLIHICSKLEAQGWGMTFNRFYVGSKYPYFISYRGKWVYLFCRGFSWGTSELKKRHL